MSNNNSHSTPTFAQNYAAIPRLNFHKETIPATDLDAESATTGTTATEEPNLIDDSPKVANVAVEHSSVIGLEVKVGRGQPAEASPSKRKQSPFKDSCPVLQDSSSSVVRPTKKSKSVASAGTDNVHDGLGSDGTITADDTTADLFTCTANTFLGVIETAKTASEGILQSEGRSTAGTMVSAAAAIVAGGGAPVMAAALSHVLSPPVQST